MLFVGLIGLLVVRRGHVIVVGLGQVGLRLCQELRALGIPVVGVKRDVHAPNLRLAQALRNPVVLGHADDRAVLSRAAAAARAGPGRRGRPGHREHGRGRHGACRRALGAGGVAGRGERGDRRDALPAAARPDLPDEAGVVHRLNRAS
jgi:threonine dehydrogenase-like Zn-dependent dehydrogenase